MSNDQQNDLRTKAIALYTAPFTFERGYIWDAAGRMVADNYRLDEEDGAVLRVRGWGRISYLDDPEALQDEVGNAIAEAMTEFWGGAAASVGRKLTDVTALRDELLAALELMVAIHDEPSGFSGKYGKALDDAIQAQEEKIDERLLMARTAITKAKGGAA